MASTSLLLSQRLIHEGKNMSFKGGTEQAFWTCSGKKRYALFININYMAGLEARHSLCYYVNSHIICMEYLPRLFSFYLREKTSFESVLGFKVSFVWLQAHSESHRPFCANVVRRPPLICHFPILIMPLCYMLLCTYEAFLFIAVTASCLRPCSPFDSVETGPCFLHHFLVHNLCIVPGV